MFKKILVATDGSPASLAAAQAGHDLAQRYGAHLTLLSVAPIPILELMQPRGSMGPEELVPKEIEQRLASATQRIVRETRESLGEAGQSVEVREIMGHPGDEICHLAEVEGFDLVVVGNHGLSALKRALLGSVSDYVVHHCKAAVLVVRAD